MEITLFYYVLNIIIPFYFNSLFSVFKTDVLGFKSIKNLLVLPKRHIPPQGGRGRQIFGVFWLPSSESPEYSSLTALIWAIIFCMSFFFHLTFSLKSIHTITLLTEYMSFKRWTDLHYTNCRYEITCPFGTLSHITEL